MDELNPHKLQAAVVYIDTWLELNFNNSRLPAMQVAIQHGDKLIYSKAFGYADVEAGEKLTTKNVFRIASHSKTFTATALMQLVEAGKLDLDDKVSKHVNWFKSSKDSRVNELQSVSIVVPNLVASNAIDDSPEEAVRWQNTLEDSYN